MMDYAISRCHAEVEIRGDEYYLKDLGSANGSYINGTLVDDRGTLLHDGDTVRFARYEFQFLSAGALYDLMRTRMGSEVFREPRPS
jgi:pSer/pThr/pTyr-binding forkhead associated (FHA) protein